MESNLNELSAGFLAYWNETVKPVAELCAPKDTWDYMYKVEREGLVADESAPEMVKMAAMKDVTGMWYVGWLIRDIGNARMRGVRLDLINSLTMITNCLSHDNKSYWTNVFGDDFTSEEATNMRKLGELMPELVKRL